jgi:RNA polymerase sigma-70 factor, ECF subfamily
MLGLPRIAGRARPGLRIQAMVNHHSPFATALVACLPRLRRYARALTGNAALADDLVQDCMERALRRAGMLNDLNRMPGWLRTILHHLYLDHARLQRSHGTGIDIVLLANDPALSTVPHDGAASVDFLRALHSLSMEHRQILLLIGLEGLSYAEAAQELGLAPGTVMSRLARARERLRSALSTEKVLVPATPSKREVH